MNRKAVLPLLVFSLSAITVTSAAVNVAAPTNRCILPKGLFPKLPPGFKNQGKRILTGSQNKPASERTLSRN
jgi:hypothetical protein